MTQDLLTLFGICLTIAAARFAWLSFQKYQFFLRGLKFRRQAIQIADEVLVDDSSPVKAKQVAAVLRVIAVSPKTLQNITDASDALKIQQGEKIFEDVPRRYADRLQTAVKNLAFAAVLADPKFGPKLAQALHANLKPVSSIKKDEIRAINSVVYLRLNAPVKERKLALC